LAGGAAFRSNVVQYTDALLFTWYPHHQSLKVTDRMNRVASADHSGALILVVEAVEETRDGMEGLLTAHGYRVDPARDEDDAVLRAGREHPDLILVSLGGPGINVIGTGLRVRERAGLSQKVPIVIFCVQTIAEGAEVEIETNVYATRPDNFDQLRALISRLLHQLPLTS
jgi:DNA-binding response OmpR family regulator